MTAAQSTAAVVITTLGVGAEPYAFCAATVIVYVVFGCSCLKVTATDPVIVLRRNGSVAATSAFLRTANCIRPVATDPGTSMSHRSSIVESVAVNVRLLAMGGSEGVPMVATVCGADVTLRFCRCAVTVHV